MTAGTAPVHGQNHGRTGPEPEDAPGSSMYGPSTVNSESRQFFTHPAQTAGMNIAGTVHRIFLLFFPVGKGRTTPLEKIRKIARNLLPKQIYYDIITKLNQ